MLCAAANMSLGPRAGWRHFAQLVARPDPEVVEQALCLALDLEEPKAISPLRGIVEDPHSPARLCAGGSCGPGGAPRAGAGGRPARVCLTSRSSRGQAVRALAAYNDPATPEIVLRRYPSFSPSEHEDAIATLAARPAWAWHLLEAIGAARSPGAT